MSKFLMLRKEIMSNKKNFSFGYFDHFLKSRSKYVLKIDHHTYCIKSLTEEINIKLYNTNVITYFPDGNIVLYVDHYYTLTTKDRINKFSPFTVFQKNYVWYVRTPFGKEYVFPGCLVFNRSDYSHNFSLAS